MKICFVDNLLLMQTAQGFQVEAQPHLGLISLIAIARNAGHEAVLYDPKLELLRGDLSLGPHFYATAAERILATGPDIVGFTSLGCNFACTMRIAEEVRLRRSDIPILLGGPHASILDREILQRYDQFDAIVRNEAELTLCAVVAAVAGSGRLSECQSVTFRDREEIRRTADAPLILDLDTLPVPAYDAYPIAELNLSQLNVDAGRGCPFHCTFCSTASFFGRRYRLKSAQRLVSDLDSLCEIYGIREFGLNHDLFTVNKIKIREFCAAVAPRGYTWNCSARIDCVDAALLGEMRNSGCKSIYYGIETGSQSLQKIVSKNLDLSLYKPIVERSLELGMQTTVSLITGYPDETELDQAATLELIDNSITSYPDQLLIQLHLLTPEPGTLLHEQFRDTLSYDGHISDFNFPHLDSRDEAAVSDDPDVFVCQRYYEAGCDRWRNIAITDGFRYLYGLGHVILRSMKDSYSGTFGDMLYDFGRLSRLERLSQADSIVSFVKKHWGSRHPLYDICKYIAAATRLRPDDAPRISSFDSHTPIRLARCIAPIGYTRDGFELGRQLHRHSKIDETTAYAWHLILADPELRSHCVIPVKRETYKLLQALSSPTTVHCLRDQFATEALSKRLWALTLMGAIASGESRDAPNQERRVTMFGQQSPIATTWDSMISASTSMGGR